MAPKVGTGSSATRVSSGSRPSAAGSSHTASGQQPSSHTASGQQPSAVQTSSGQRGEVETFLEHVVSTVSEASGRRLQNVQRTETEHRALVAATDFAEHPPATTEAASAGHWLSREAFGSVPPDLAEFVRKKGRARRQREQRKRLRAGKHANAADAEDKNDDEDKYDDPTTRSPDSSDSDGPPDSRGGALGGSSAAIA